MNTFLLFMKNNFFPLVLELLTVVACLGHSLVMYILTKTVEILEEVMGHFFYGLIHESVLVSGVPTLKTTLLAWQRMACL